MILRSNKSQFYYVHHVLILRIGDVIGLFATSYKNLPLVNLVIDCAGQTILENSQCATLDRYSTEKLGAVHPALLSSPKKTLKRERTIDGIAGRTVITIIARTVICAGV